MSDPLRHFDNLICIAEFVPMSDERKEMLRQAASELARLRFTDEERECLLALRESDHVLLPRGEKVIAGLLERTSGTHATPAQGSVQGE